MALSEYLPMRAPMESPAWTRWAVPSVVDQTFIALLCVLVCTPLSRTLLWDPDIGWHIRAGQHILDMHTITMTDPFSSTMYGKPWTNWEWLYDVIVGVLERFAGLNGVTWFAGAIVIGVFCWVFRSLVERGTQILFALALTLLSVAASMIHLLARPHIVSWLFALIYFWALDTTDNEAPKNADSRRLWLLPAIMVLWVNLHGGFILGLMLIGVYWLSSIVPPLHSGHPRPAKPRWFAARARTKELTWIGLACGAATLLNPYGWGLHASIYTYLTNHFYAAHVNEMQSPDFHGVAPQCFLALILITVALVTVRSSKVRTSQLFVVLFAIYSGLYAARGLPTSAMLLALIAGPLLPASRARVLRDIADTEMRQTGHLWPLAAIVLTGCIALNGGRVGGAHVMNADFDPKRVPATAVDYIERTGIRSPILSIDSWGGYLTYRLFPRSQVILDDRHSFFGVEFMESYLRMLGAGAGWDGFLRAHPPALIVLPREAPLAGLLDKTAGWQSVYRDNVSIVFAPSSMPTSGSDSAPRG